MTYSVPLVADIIFLKFYIFKREIAFGLTGYRFKKSRVVVNSSMPCSALSLNLKLLASSLIALRGS